MVAERGVFVRWFGVQIADQDGYREYRRRMTPLLHEYGGDFEYDLAVAQVLRQPCTDSAMTSGQREASSEAGASQLVMNPGGSLHRVFSMVFPSVEVSEAFFSDANYLAIRRAYFEPSIRRVAELARFCRARS